MTDPRITELPPLKVALFIVQESLLIAPLVCHVIRQVSSHLATSTAQLFREHGPFWANRLSQGMIITTQITEIKQQTKMQIRRDQGK